MVAIVEDGRGEGSGYAKEDEPVARGEAKAESREAWDVLEHTHTMVCYVDLPIMRKTGLPSASAALAAALGIVVDGPFGRVAFVPAAGLAPGVAGSSDMLSLSSQVECFVSDQDWKLEIYELIGEGLGTSGRRWQW